MRCSHVITCLLPQLMGDMAHELHLQSRLLILPETVAELSKEGGDSRSSSCRHGGGLLVTYAGLVQSHGLTVEDGTSSTVKYNA